MSFKLESLATCLVLHALTTFGVWAGPVHAQTVAQSQSFEKMTYTADTSLRDFVGTHLGDPDLWPYVLHLNQISDPVDLEPNDVLEMPVAQVRAADAALEGSLEAIQTATAQGAQVFAAKEIGEAIASRETAVEQRAAFEWGQVVDLSNIATLLAHEALEIAITQRDLSAEAIVSDVQGDVEGRAPAAPRWSDRGQDDILVEFERVRTLSKSTTQITFRDLSRLRLNANSNATIQRMRSDPLTGDEVTKVSLVNGDFYAVLNQLSDRTAFEIDVPGIDTETASSDFWVKNDANSARFVNYDNANLEVSRDGTTVILGENEGVVLGSDAAQTSQVLDGPALRQPARDIIVYTEDAQLSWDSVDQAAGYWLEVSRDAGFNEMQVSEWGILTPDHLAIDLPPARYFWRVSALDALGLPGQWSKPSHFTMRRDTTDPFLTLLSHGTETVTAQPRALVFGATEQDARVVLNGSAVALNSDGSFEVDLPLVAGPNPVVVVATDPAGNTATLEYNIAYRPASLVAVVFDPSMPTTDDVFVTRSDKLSLRAQTTGLPGAPVSVLDANGTVVLQTILGDAGALTFGVPVTQDVQGYRIDVFSPDGKSEGTAAFFAQLDIMPPPIVLDTPLPRATDDPLLRIAGVAEGAVKLEIDGQPLPLVDGRFALDMTLERDLNEFDLVATDAVGNVTAKRLKTVYDIDPPVITEANVTRPDGNTGAITISVVANDISGLRKSATYLIEIAGVEQSGFLRCEPSTGMCTASLPPEPGGIQLIEVAVEDYAGNIAFK